MFQFIDLCCGIGAFHITLKRLGGSCALASDVDHSCKEVYIENHGDHQKWIDDLYCIEKLPKHDVLCAGFPCQPFSSAGKRQGRADEAGRGTIVYQIMKLLRACKPLPRLVIFENVFGILQTDNGVVAAYVRNSLVQLGYDVKVLLVDAIDMGGPMNRTRVFFVGLKAPLKIEGEPVSNKTPIVLEDVLEKGEPVRWRPKGTYTLLPKSQWTTTDDGKVFVGYTSSKSSVPPEKHFHISAHGQGTKIWHVKGAIETFTGSHKYFIYIPGRGVRYLSIREMYNCMGFPHSFKFHHVKRHAMHHICNSINIFALKPVVTWAVGLAKLS